MIATVVIGYALSFIGFRELVSIMYPILRYIGFVMLLILAVAWIKEKSNIQGEKFLRRKMIRLITKKYDDNQEYTIGDKEEFNDDTINKSEFCKLSMHKGGLMFEQVKLGYAFDALEPHIDTLTMETHYGKHHAAYTKNFNEAVDKAGLSDKSVEEILSSLPSVSDEALRNTLQNNGGGYYNHNLYFSILSPKKDTKPSPALEEAIKRDFGSLEKLIETLQNLALGQFGSGWAFLSVDQEGKLYATKAANQNNPFMEEGKHSPILALDVWEHAYYLKYKNLRGDYVKNFFEVLDWEEVSKNYENFR